MNVFFHRGNAYLISACVCLDTWPNAAQHLFELVRAGCHLELGFTNAASPYPLLSRGFQFSFTLSPQVHEDFSSSKRRFPTPHAHTMKAVLALNLILVFLSESRKKHFMVWIVQRGGFFCV